MVAAGGGLGFLEGASIVLLLFEAMHLGVDVFLCSFLVHLDDAVLPFRVGGRDPEADVGDDSGVVSGNPFSYGLYEDSSFALVIKASCQFGLPFHLLEE